MTRQNRTKPGTGELALFTMTTRQAAAVELVAVGKTDQEVADAVGVTRQTVNVWRHVHPAFAAAVEERRHEVWGVASDRLRSLLPKAVDAVEDALDGPDGWRVALQLVKLTGMVDQDRLRPRGPRDPQ